MNYQGWSNRATWHVNLWLSNDASAYRHWRDQVEYVKTQRSDNRSRINLLADFMRDEISGERPAIEGSYGDLLGAALRDVDWEDIAADWLAQ